MGWTNIETGEVKSPYPWLRESELSVDEKWEVHAAGNASPFTLHSSLQAFAFSGIHSFSPHLFRLMDRFPDRFPIMDFYLSTCHRAHISGVAKDDLQVLDVGKPETLRLANSL